MIELLIAGAVMVVGFLGVIVLITTAVASNNRNKMDTTSALVGQMVMEQVGSVPANSTQTRTMTDCAGNSWTVAAAPGGAALSSGSINFSSSTVANYNMLWVVCIGSVHSTYDVRWNVQQLTSLTSLVTVGVRHKGAGSNLRYFALPINVQRIIGQ